MTAHRSVLVWIVIGPLLGVAAANALPGENNRGPDRLSLEERIAYQRAIEAVHWRHRQWPRENSEPKPSLDAVIGEEGLRAIVEDYLAKSRALEHYWQRPITDGELQAEVDRQARQTRQPELLRELWAALDNDPLVVAECLARPALADRLIRSWYATDSRFHAQLKASAADTMAARASIKGLRDPRGRYLEEEWVRQGLESCPPSPWATETTPCLELAADQWDRRVETLAAGRGEVQEDGTRVYAEKLLAQSPSHVRVARIEWQKRSFDQWWRSKGLPELSQTPGVAFQPQGKEGLAAARPGVGAAEPFVLPQLAATSYVDGGWSPTEASAPTSRDDHSAVWTGAEMIVWGGYGDLATGGRYDPATDTWRPTTQMNAPAGRHLHTAVWTGIEMIIWGGTNAGGRFNSGARYNPTLDTWTGMTTTDAPAARYGHSAVWTGSLMVVWGGDPGGAKFTNTGGRYNPGTDSWAPTAVTGVPEARSGHTAVWTGSQVIVWGGLKLNTFTSPLKTGGRYDPVADSWTPTSEMGTPSARDEHSAVWTGSEMIVWGDDGGSQGTPGTGARYNPTTDSWAPTATSGAPGTRPNPAAVWTGTEMIIWGGGTYYASAPLTDTGGRYDPATDTWAPMSMVNVPPKRYSFTAVWTGLEMIVWGGNTDTGGRYDPMTDTWVPTRGRAPWPRQGHSAVWTGNEMLVWGGGSPTGASYHPGMDLWSAIPEGPWDAGTTNNSAVWTGKELIVWGGTSTATGTKYWLATGARYNPTLRTWTKTSTAGVPRPREEHTAVWTGSEMIIWGGYNPQDQRLSSGGRYNPLADAWVSLPTTGAPSARQGHSAVWTGTEMIVWGGDVSSGGRYNRAADAWAPTSTTNAPAYRSGNTAIWSGSEMIVWGGFDGVSALGTGGRYNPSSDIWTATSAAGAPAPRLQHSAIWTGNEMVVWGGFDYASYLSTGARYTPATDSWAAVGAAGAPTPRKRHSAVWSGAEMIIWGGNDGVANLDTGAAYCLGCGLGIPPTAQFSWQPPVPAVGQDVQFTDGSSESPSAWFWSFGDGLTSRLQHPVHVYRAGGSFTVSLTAANTFGSATATQRISVGGMAPVADLGLAMSDSPDPVVVDANLTYILTVANGGPDAATGVVVTDTLPTATTFTSAAASQGNCGCSAGVVTCPLGSLASAGTATITIVVAATQAGELSNTASITGNQDDPNVANNSASASTTVNAPAATYSYLVPSVAHNPGSGDTQWRTDVASVNLEDTAAALSLTYLSDTAPRSRTATLAAKATTSWRDILVGLFGLATSANSSGSLRIDSDRPIFVTSRTYNQTATGTYGQYYPACTLTEALEAGSMGVLPQLEKSSAFRTNIGILNLGSSPVSVVVKLYNAAGVQVGSTKTLAADSSRWKQQYDFFAYAGAGAQTVAYATVEVQTPGGQVWAYASVIDAVTGDATTIPVLIRR